MNPLITVRAVRALGLAVITAGILSACGGGGGGSQTYSVSGNLTGLAAGAAVVLSVNGQNQTLNSNGGFTTSLALTSGSTYAVTVATQPSAETCTVTNGSGVIASSNVNNIQVACSANPAKTYTIGGSLSGLASGAGVVLQDNGGDNLTVSASGTFTFHTALVNQAAYNVTVLTQPTGQTCSVTGAAGTVQGANVSSVRVACANNPPPTVTIGGSLAGLPAGASVVLQDNGGDNLSLNANGSFTFATAIGSGSPYAVTVLTQPAQATCSVANGNGTAGNSNVTNVQVSCTANASSYSIGGNLSGLAAGTSVVLQDNGGDNLTVTNNGAFTFASNVAAGNPYDVTVLTQPRHQTCTVTNGSGTANANVTNVQVACVANPQFAYVANNNNGGTTVSGFSVGADGALTPVPGSPFTTGINPNSVTVNPAGTLAFVANKGDFTGQPNYKDSTVSVYSIGANGALTPVPGSPFLAGKTAVSVTVNPAGTFAYVADAGGSAASGAAVLAYSIGANGALTPVPGSPFPVQAVPACGCNSEPYSVTVNPAGTFAYVAQLGTNTIAAYSIDATTGALTPVAGAPFADGGAGTDFWPWSVTVNPAGTFAYVANNNNRSVSVFSIGANGALTPVAGSPFPAGGSPVSVTVNPAGTFAYVANAISENVSAYSIGANGVLTPVAGSPFTAGPVGGPNSVTVNPAGTFAYVTIQATGNNVTAYSIGANGALTPIAGSPFTAGAYPGSIVVTQR